MATFTNQATLTYNNTVITSNVTAGELIEVLSVSKTAFSPFYVPGGTVTYAVSLLNSGASDLTGLTLTDTLGGYLFDSQTLTPLTYAEDSLHLFVNGVLQPAPSVTPGPPLTVTGLTVPAGGSAMLLYEAEVNSFAPPAAGSEIVNTVTVQGSASAEASETITVSDAPNLTITKAISPASVAENGSVTYTFTVANSSGTAAEGTDNVSISDTFSPVLSNLNVLLDGEPIAKQTQYTYSTESGLFTTVPGQITVPAASFAQDPVSGVWSVTPGTTVLTVSGTI